MSHPTRWWLCESFGINPKGNCKATLCQGPHWELVTVESSLPHVHDLHVCDKLDRFVRCETCRKEWTQ